METYRAVSNWITCGSKFSLDQSLAQIELADSLDICLLALVAVFISLILDGLKLDIDKQVTGLVEKIVDDGGILEKFQNGFEKIVHEIDSKIDFREDNPSNSSKTLENSKDTGIGMNAPRHFSGSSGGFHRRTLSVHERHKVKKNKLDSSKIEQKDLEAYHRVKSLLTNITNVLNEKKANKADGGGDELKDIMGSPKPSEINPKDKLPITKEDIEDYMRVYSLFNRITGSKHKHLSRILTANWPRQGPMNKSTPHPPKPKHKPILSHQKKIKPTISPFFLFFLFCELHNQ